MLMLTAFVLAALSTVVAGGKIGRLRNLEFRAGFLCGLALAVQILVISVLPAGSFSAAGHVASYILIAGFLLANRALPGLKLIALGAILNFAAISVNGGVMPAREAALAAAGMEHGVGAEFENSGAVEDPKLAFLGDVFAIPEPWIFANVFSVGDVLIGLGAAIGMHVTCGSRLARRRSRAEESRSDDPAVVEPRPIEPEPVMLAEPEPVFLTEPVIEPELVDLTEPVIEPEPARPAPVWPAVFS